MLLVMCVRAYCEVCVCFCLFVFVKAKKRGGVNGLRKVRKHWNLNVNTLHMRGERARLIDSKSKKA